MNKRGLGRGIDALITPIASREDEVAGEVDIRDIMPNNFQPRRVFEEESLNQLAESIRQHGILQPVVVRKVESGYELVTGERRWRAAKIAGLRTIPAVIREYSDREMTEIALVENIQRENLNPVEEAEAYHRLIDEFRLTQEDVARKVGRSRSMVANVIRLLNLPPEIREHVSRGTLSMGQAKPLLGLESPELQMEAANTIIENGLSARDSEELVRRLMKAPRLRAVKNREKSQLFIKEAEEQLRMILGTQVRIKPGKLKSKIEIEVYSSEDLERIIELLSGQTQAAATRSKGVLIV